ncbi:MAG: hypothetical protein ACK5TK_04320 [Betaproteobacteria bacterium]
MAQPVAADLHATRAPASLGERVKTRLLLRISAIVDGCFSLIVDGVSA